MIANIASATLLGISGQPVTVEVHVSNGLPGLALVGLPDTACREARDRVRAAMLSSGLEWPQRRMTVNLAPSEVRKVGTGFDLAMAVGLLVANGSVASSAVEGMAFVGELGLDGTIRAVSGIVPLVDAIAERLVVVPETCLPQAALVGRDRVCSAATLQDLVSALGGETFLTRPSPAQVPARPEEPDLADVRGQPLARWAVEVAAAGGHNLLMTGPPGSGKTMLARRIPGLLPDLEAVTALECTKIHSAAGTLDSSSGLIVRPPFRAPHHTSSMVSIVGGGTAAMRPGEASLAHGGVLFLDEMCEFPRSVLDTLRQPLEEGAVRVSRSRGTVSFPARFLLVGATNPCPCGEGLVSGFCKCSEPLRERYAARLSGPLLDRFDVRIVVGRPIIDSFFGSCSGEDSTTVAERVRSARQRAAARNVTYNAALSSRQLEEFAPLSANAERLLAQCMKNGSLSARGLHRVRRVALTLADIDGVSVLDDSHIAGALQLRMDTARLERTA